MSGFATIDQRGSPVQDAIEIMVNEHLDTEKKQKKAIAVNKIMIDQIKRNLNEISGAVGEALREFETRLDRLELLLPPPPPPRSQTPSGGRKKKKRRKRTRKKKRKN